MEEKIQKSKPTCLDSALGLLSLRMRSQGEMRQRLLRKNYEVEEVEAVMERLKELKLLDDREYAEAWSRQHLNRSQRALKQDFYHKGILSDDLNGVDLGDDQSKANSLVQQKMRSVSMPDWQNKNRIYQYLQRRGFEGHVINQALHPFFPD